MTQRPSVSLFQDIKNLIGKIFKFLFTVVLVLSIVAFVLWWLLPDTWRIKYAAQYTVDTDHVEIEHKPYNCDWDSAPIGSKHCHYEKIVIVVNAQNQVVDGTGVKVGATNTTISFDDGKTWETNPASDNMEAIKVHVGWQRVED